MGGRTPISKLIRVRAFVRARLAAVSGTLNDVVVLGDVAVTAKGVLSSYVKDSEKYYNLDVLEVDLVIKKAYMHVSKVNNNRIIGEYIYTR